MSPRRQRLWTVTPLVAAAHLAVVALLVLTVSAPPRFVEAPLLSLSLYPGLEPSPEPPGPPALTAPPPLPEPLPEAARPAQPEALALAALMTTVDVAAEPVPLDDASEADVTGAPTPAGSSGDVCGLGQVLRGRLSADPEALAGLSRLPRRSRSVANAVMLWDGRWVERPGTAEALAPVRRALIDTVRSASPTCMQAENRGPVFLVVEGAGEPLLLTVGSGVWRWSSLLEGAGPVRGGAAPKRP